MQMPLHMHGYMACADAAPPPLGTNLGHKRENLAKAIESIRRFGKIDRTSAHYESPAWGYESNASYLNQVLLLHTAMEPELLMQGLLAVEQELGRERLTEGRGGKASRARSV